MKQPENQPLIDLKDAQSFMTRTGADDDLASRQVCMKMPVSLLTKCDEAAKELSLTRSAFIKLAIQEKLKRDSKER